MTEFRLQVSYAQLAVFRSDMENPFNDWTDQHVAQGFSWRPGSVSFRTLVESGSHIVTVEVVDHLGALDATVVRAIEVPFSIPSEGCIEVSTISESRSLPMIPGNYQLRCELLVPGDDGRWRAMIKFVSRDQAQFAVVRADSGLEVGEELLTAAQAAVTY